MERYHEAYRKYIKGVKSQTEMDAEYKLQNVYISTTVYKNGKRIGVIAENLDTKEVFFIEQQELNRKIEGKEDIIEPYFGKNIRLVRRAMRNGEDIVFPYTTKILEV